MKNYAYWLAVWLLTSCLESHQYYKDYELEQQVWDRADTLKFAYTQKAGEPDLNLFLNFRHDLTYPYYNVYLLLNTKYPTGAITTDTIMLYLQNPQNGQYYGKGYTKVLQQDIELKSQAIQEEGTFHFELIHGMRDSLLPGVHSVGLRLQSENP